MFCHMILQLVNPFAFVPTFWAKIFALILVNPHVILKQKQQINNIVFWLLQEECTEMPHA